MHAKKVTFNREKETLLITLYAKAKDARSAHPILGDTTAVSTVERVDYDFGRFSWDDSVGAAARAKVLDTYVREFIAEHPDAIVLHLGCGLDARCVRVDPPATVSWYDVDYPDVVALRRELVPEHTACTPVGASVTDADWLEGLPTGRPVVVVAEGLVMYLAEEQVRALLRRVVDHFGTGELAFDTISPLCVRLMKYHPSVKLTGARMRWGLGDVHEPERWDPRLTLAGVEPTVGSRVVPDMPLRDRIACGFMNAVPPLRDLARLVRYRF